MSYTLPYDTSNIIETIQQTGLWKRKLAFIYNIFGRRAGFTSTSLLNDVKEFDNSVALIPILSNSALDIISSSINDTNTAGTGIRQVKVLYIDASNNIVQSPAISLDGTTLVTNVLTGVNEVLSMESFTSGSGVVAAGNIRLRINGGVVEVEQISINTNRSMSARFMVPAGYTGYLHAWNTQSANNDQDVRLRATVDTFTRALTTEFHFVSVHLSALNTSSGNINLPFLTLPPLCKIRVATISAGVGAAVKCEASFQLVLIEN